MENRLEVIANIISQRGFQSVLTLSEELKVSKMTIRRDLEKLEKKQMIRRTFGGAYSYKAQEMLCREEKIAIGREAFSLIKSNESIFIDAGSTAAFFAGAIDSTKKITVITNSFVVAEKLKSKENIETIFLGGKIHSETNSTVGFLAEEEIGKFHYTKAFLGTSGINFKKGFTANTIEEIPIKKQAASNAEKVIILADYTKLKKNVLIPFLKLKEADVFITDGKAEKKDLEMLKKENIEVVVAK